MQYEDLDLLMPARELSTKALDKGQELEQQGLDIRYKEDYRAWKKRVEAFEKNKPKFYALINANYCTQTMRSRIEEHPDYETKIADDPIALLEAIRILMHDPMRARYPLRPWWTALPSTATFGKRKDKPCLIALSKSNNLEMC